MKKIFALLITFITIMTLSVACQRTPEQPVVIDKRESIEEKVITNEEPTSQTQQPGISTYEVPDTYSATLKAGGVNTIIDAKVSIPDNNLQSVILSPRELTQEFADIFINCFSGDASLYIKTSEGATMETLQQEILRWKECLFNAQNKWDEVKGHDPYGETQQDSIDEFNNIIEQLTNQLQTAPEVAEYEPTSRQLKHPVGEGKDYSWGTEMIEDTSQFGLTAYARAETSNISDHMARYYIMSNDNAASVLLSYENVNDPAEVGYILSREQRETMGDKMTMPLEEAQGYAQQAINSIGANDMVLYDYDCNPGIKDGQPYPYYDLEYCRSIGGVPLPDLWRADILPRGESYGPNPREALGICVDESGVIRIDWRDPVAIGEVLDDNVSIMAFDELIELAKRQLEMQSYSSDTALEIVITDISLSLMPVKMQDSRDKLTVPVWDFMGYHYDPNDAQAKQEAADMDFRYSYLTINAIDGSIIDRKLGY